MAGPDIVVYCFDHSPWAQIVLLTLEIKGLSYRVQGAPGPATVMQLIQQSSSSMLTMPAMWYDGVFYHDSLAIIRVLEEKHPEPSLFGKISKEEVSEDLAQLELQALFAYAPTYRIAGWKIFKFWNEFSKARDDVGSTLGHLAAAAGRAFLALYFFSLLNILRNMMKKFSVAICEAKAGPALEHFETLLKKGKGSFLRHDCLTYTDIALLGHFQCMSSGLSDEVLELVDRRSPMLWKWLQQMHAMPCLKGYSRMYTRSSPEVCKRLAVQPVPYEYGSLATQVVYWLTLASMALCAPLTLFVLMVSVGYRFYVSSKAKQE